MPGNPELRLRGTLIIFDIVDKHNRCEQEPVNHKRRQALRLDIPQKEFDAKESGYCGGNRAHT